MKTIKIIASAMLMALVSLSSSTAFSATPAATQWWVRNYVATNPSSTVPIPNTQRDITVSTIEDGVSVEITLKMDDSNNLALVVMESEEPALQKGLKFVDDGAGNFINMTNSVCSTIVGERILYAYRYSDDRRYEYATNGTSVTTQIVASVTNKVYKMRYSFSVGGTRYAGVKRDGGMFWCTTLGEGPRRDVKFAVTRISDREASILKTPVKAEVSILDLIFGLFAPSAYAVWDLSMSEPIRAEYLDYSDNEYNYYGYEQHYEWRGPENSWKIKEIVIKMRRGGQEFSYPIDIDLEVFQLGDGVDYCDYKPFISGADKLVASIFLDVENYIKGLPDMSASDKDYLVRRINEQQDDVLSQILQRFNEIVAEIGTPSGECPQKSYEKEKKEQETEPPEEEPIPDPKCKHEKCAEGSYCGYWRCAFCSKVFTSDEGAPMHHKEPLVDNGETCAYCGNKFRGATCSYISKDWRDHHYGKRNGDAQSCICDNGGFRYGGGRGEHIGPCDPGKDWHSDDTGHWKFYTCRHCTHVRNIEDGDIKPHIPKDGEASPSPEGCLFGTVCSVCEYPMTEPTLHPHEPIVDTNESGLTWDDDGHYSLLSYKCGVCGQPGIDGSETPVGPHDFISDGNGFHDLGDGTHAEYLICSSSTNRGGFCGIEGHMSEPEAHTQGQPSLVDVGERGHYETWICTATGCGYTFIGPTNSHEWVYALSSSAEAKDIRKCACGRREELNHNFSYNDTIHFCTQNGQMHLYGFHQFGDGNICAVCGYDKSGPPDYEYETWTAYSDCGHCYRVYQHSRPIGSSTWGPTTVASTHCDYDWDESDDTCGCPACKAGYSRICYCEHGSTTPGKVPNGNESMTGGMISILKQMWGADFTTLDGDDPVYDIQAGALKDAFSGYANLEIVKFNYVTNVGIKGCSYAFANCDRLTNVQFSALKSVSANGFESAFEGCTSLSSIDFPNLEVVGDSGFSGAFTGCSSLTNVAFGSLKSAGQLCFNAAFTNAIIERIDFSSLTNIRESSFSYAGLNVRSIDFSNVRSVEHQGLFTAFNSLIEVLSLPRCVRVEAYAFTGNSTLTSIDLPSIEWIGSYAFSGCSSLAEIPSKVALMNDIPEGSFSECSSITNANVAAEAIGAFAFSGATNLMSLTANNCKTVGDSAFFDTPKLVSISIPLASYIGTYAFASCGMSFLNLPAATEVGIGAFEDCMNLKRVILPKAKHIGDHIFENCIIIEEVTVGVTKAEALENNYYSARYGCVFHCTDGDVTVP